MLSKKSVEIITSTVPVLEVHGTAITKRFYDMLFANHPDLLNIFNHANQKQGRQQVALANAVYAAAKNIDKLEMILPLVKQISHKHRSLGIKAEHYPIVGKYLLAAIQDVLGSAATEDILGAWAEAYGIIANAFIGVENELYAQSEKQAGGWLGSRAFNVQRQVRESEGITSFYLVPLDGKEIAAFQPGQYVSVKVDIPGEPYTQIRQYSLSDSPGKPYYRISVKREDAGDLPAGKVSVYLHSQVEAGNILWISSPAGAFVLDQTDARPVVLISGGIGLTPMISMLNSLVETVPSRPVTFIHAAQNSQAHAMRQQVEELAHKHPQVSAYWCYDRPTKHDTLMQLYHKTGYIDLTWLQTTIPTRDVSFYFCGSIPFMQHINRALKEWDVPQADIHYEFFGPAGSLD